MPQSLTGFRDVHSVFEHTDGPAVAEQVAMGSLLYSHLAGQSFAEIPQIHPTEFSTLES